MRLIRREGRRFVNIIGLLLAFLLVAGEIGIGLLDLFTALSDTPRVLPYVLVTTGVDFGGMTPLGWACLLCVGLLHSGVAYVLYFSALRTLPGQEAAILSYIDPLVAVVISLTVLGEPVTGLQLLGGAMILAFTLVNEL